MIQLIILAVDVVIVLLLMYGIGELVEMQEEQGDGLKDHEDRLNSLELYADYIRDEIMELKKRQMKGEQDNGGNINVRWRRRRIETGD